MSGIFISYRRDDSSAYAGRLYDQLSDHFGTDQVFIDIDTIEPGEDFREVIHRRSSSCSVALIVIGRSWIGQREPGGKSRLEDVTDFVRLEVSSALRQQGLRVIPVLVGGAQMPDPAILPEDIRDLSFRNAWEITDKRFRQDVVGLIEFLEKILKSAGSSAASPRTPEAKPEVTPPPNPPSVSAPPTAREAADIPAIAPPPSHHQPILPVTPVRQAVAENRPTLEQTPVRQAISKSAWSQVTPPQRRTLLAAVLGWMLDAFDSMLLPVVLVYVIAEFGMTKAEAGLLGSLTLLASGIGGVLFGFLADRIGRKRALMLSILTYSLCSFASGLATSVLMLATFRFLLGLGMGGEWNTGATLVAETWPTELRAKALAIVQSSFAIGYALAALVAGAVLHYFGWRAVFFVGIIPALLVLWIQKKVPESEMWLSQHGGTQERGDKPQVQSVSREATSSSSFAEIFRPPYRKSTVGLLLLNFFGMFAWWGLFTWIPPYLSLPAERGGKGISLVGTTQLLLILNLAGMLPGYTSFGWVADRIGRRKAFIVYTSIAALLVPLYAMADQAWSIMVTGTALAFFGTGFFSGSSIIGSEIFPTRVRARALGFTYSGARTMSAIAPFIIGEVGQTMGLGWAFYLCGASFLLASIVATQLPETKGKLLE